MRKNHITMIIIIAAAMLFAASAVFAGEKQLPLPEMTLEEYPRIDGSLACVPLCEALAVRATGCSQEEAEETMADFTNTNPCYLELAKGNRDILLAYEPAQETVDALAEYEPLDMAPVGRDALVFIVNRDNPVESITQQQAIDIYTGKITNWSEVGGDDQEILAFQRPETSGSQTMMRKLLMGDLQMVDAPEMMISGMEGMIRQIREYENTANALGYSVYYYATEMMGFPDLKFLSVDGVAPDKETIGSGEYPLVNDFYCVTNAQSSENALLLRDWLLSADGQAFIEECGYVPLS